LPKKTNASIYIFIYVSPPQKNLLGVVLQGGKPWVFNHMFPKLATSQFSSMPRENIEKLLK
jgi:hypothetical protein